MGNIVLFEKYLLLFEIELKQIVKSYGFTPRIGKYTFKDVTILMNGKTP